MLLTAIRFLLYDKPKSIGALFGIIISIFLIGQQCGIFIFLTNAMCALVRSNSQYIWVVDSKTTNVNALAPLDSRIGREMESIPGVKKVYPIVLAVGAARFANGKSSSVTLIGTQAPDFAGGPWNVIAGKKEDLLQEGAVFTEFFDSRNLGDIKLGEYFEINDRKVWVAGNTRGVRLFGGPVAVFSTIERVRSLGRVSTTRTSAFLVSTSDGTDPVSVINAINAHMYGVRAWNAQEFADSTVSTVLKSSGIAISIGTLLVFALISGFVIIGLTLYSASIDRLKDYGTLKAIGASNQYITRLIMTQALILALVGYGIGIALVEGFRIGISNAGTLFEYPLWLECSFFLVTLTISLGGSYFAIRRIIKLEPAQAFRA